MIGATSDFIGCASLAGGQLRNSQELSFAIEPAMAIAPMIAGVVQEGGLRTSAYPRRALPSNTTRVRQEIPGKRGEFLREEELHGVRDCPSEGRPVSRNQSAKAEESVYLFSSNAKD